MPFQWLEVVSGTVLHVVTSARLLLFSKINSQLLSFVLALTDAYTPFSGLAVFT